MAVEINPGYMGIADVGGVGEVRFDSSSVNARQEIEAPDLIMGDYDHDAYVYGKIDVSGSISGPMTETFIRADGSLISLWEWGTDRDENTGQLVNTSDIDITYYNGRSRNFTGMEASSLGFSCASGDIAQFSIDVIGRSAGDWGTNAGGALNPQAPAGSALNEKLITWDQVTVAVTPTAGDPGPNLDPSIPIADTSVVAYSNIDVTIGNNCEPVYSLFNAGDSPHLFPFDIVTGIRTISGTLSLYNIPDYTSESGGVTSWCDYDADNYSIITISFGGSCAAYTPLTIPIRCRFHRVEAESSVGPITSTVGFTGVTHQMWTY